MSKSPNTAISIYLLSVCLHVDCFLPSLPSWWEIRWKNKQTSKQANKMMTKELPVTVTKSYQRGKQNVTYSMKKKSQQSVITVPEKELRTLERNPDTGDTLFACPWHLGEVCVTLMLRWSICPFWWKIRAIIHSVDHNTMKAHFCALRNTYSGNALFRRQSRRCVSVILHDAFKGWVYKRGRGERGKNTHAF